MRARHWMRGLVVALLTVAAGIAVYVARNCAAAEARREVATTRSAPTATRGEPTYKGKTFDEWRALLGSELDSARRREPLWALAVLGASARTEEAARAIIDVAESLSGFSSVRIQVDNAEMQAFPELKADFELLSLAPLAFLRLEPKAVPVAVEVWRDAERSTFVRQLAAEMLARMPIDKSLADTFVEALCDPNKQVRDDIGELLSAHLDEEQLALALVERLDGAVLSEALLQLVAKLPPQHNRDVVQRLVERSRSKDPAIRKAAGLGVASAGVLDPAVAQRLDIDRDELYTAARIVIEEGLGPQSRLDGKQITQIHQALAVLKDGSPLAREAVPVLEKIVHSPNLDAFKPAASEALRSLTAE